MRWWCGEIGSLFLRGAVLSGLLVSCSGENAPFSSPNQTESLAGVDADANGGGDDVDQYIDATYADQASADLNKAVHQYAKAVQSSRVHADSQTQSLTHAMELFRALEGLFYRPPRPTVKYAEPLRGLSQGR